MVKDGPLFLSNKELQNSIKGATKLIEIMGFTRETQLWWWTEESGTKSQEGVLAGYNDKRQGGHQSIPASRNS